MLTITNFVIVSILVRPIELTHLTAYRAPVPARCSRAAAGRAATEP
jgi:hypothetical protein